MPNPRAKIVTHHTKRREFSQRWVMFLLLLVLVPIPILAYQLWQTPDFVPAPTPVRVSPPQAPEQTASPLPPCLERPPKAGTCFNHLPYAEAPQSDLQTVAITSDGSPIQLRTAAASKFRKMQSAALRAGINLYLISGFRNVAVQERLFYDIARQRGQDLATRARVSAPPGYSEHHTGYAIDIGDADSPSTELSIAFEHTRAFRWLQQNAGRYGFELSFPKSEPQGVSYEPWHWRFVGDAESRSVFRK